jgi:drug/metabolite transporter (DMT)-like permease
MLLEALVGGLLIGLVTGHSLIRLHQALPDKSPVLTSVLLSLAALTTVTLLIEVPSKFLLPTEAPLRYFLIAGLFNAIRVPALGVAMGCLYRKFVTADRRERVQNGTYA